MSQKNVTLLQYVDDIWGVWPHSREDFDIFLGILNSFNPSITIKSTSSPTSVDFLDTTTFKDTTFKETHRLDIKVFFKETDTHALLFKTSFHPGHTYAGLIKSQLLRFHRICSREVDFYSAVKVLFRALSSRGYSRSFLRKCQRNFLVKKPIMVGSSLTFVTTYSPSTRDLVRGCRERFLHHTRDKDVLQDFRIIPAFRRNRNLQDFLVKAKIRPLYIPQVRNPVDYFKQRTWLQSHSTKEVFHIMVRGHVKCKNCVYLIMCQTCGLQYVGETGNSIATRMAQHKYNITNRKKVQTPLVAHFTVHGWKSLSTSILQCNPRWSAPLRRRAERLWINKLDTLHPKGLNEG